MKVTFWGTRGSLPASGPETQYYGGNTPCIGITSGEHLVVLDAGSGIRRLGMHLNRVYPRVDIFLTHLHTDHIQGMGFFQPLYQPGCEIHIWGPASDKLSLAERLGRYLSPPLFPIYFRDLPSNIHFHELPCGDIPVGDLTVRAEMVTHPGPTVGYRVSNSRAALTYLPDHEPALGARYFPQGKEWTSGFDLAYRTDLLIHDAQFTSAEYPQRIGWGHSTYEQAILFAQQAEVRQLLFFHHDPARTDEQLSAIMNHLYEHNHLPFQMGMAREGTSREL